MFTLTLAFFTITAPIQTGQRESQYETTGSQRVDLVFVTIIHGCFGDPIQTSRQNTLNGTEPYLARAGKTPSHHTATTLLLPSTDDIALHRTPLLLHERTFDLTPSLPRPSAVCASAALDLSTQECGSCARRSFSRRSRRARLTCAVRSALFLHDHDRALRVARSRRRTCCRRLPHDRMPCIHTHTHWHSLTRQPITLAHYGITQ